MLQQNESSVSEESDYEETLTDIGRKIIKSLIKTAIMLLLKQLRKPGEYAEFVRSCGCI